MLEVFKEPVSFALKTLLNNRLWCYRLEPFPHFWASDVFVPEFCHSLEVAQREILARGLSEQHDPDRFSRNMLYSDAYSWNFPPQLYGPLGIFYSREWHDLLATLTQVKATGDVTGSLHHHHVGSQNGAVHNDLNVAWFSTQKREDGINPMDIRRCRYTDGYPYEAGLETRETIRAVTMIYYFGNPTYMPGNGGETGLYSTADQPVERPTALIPPTNNSILLFENTPYGYHSFIRNTCHTRNSIILWLHRTKEEGVGHWGQHRISQW
jgi:hypothetical protein